MRGGARLAGGVMALAMTAVAMTAVAAAAADPAAARRDAEAGMAALRDGDLEGAAALLRRALAAEPGNARVATDLGYVLGKRGERREAEGFLRRAIALDPRRFYAYANLAELAAEDPGRWQRRDEIIALLERGLVALGEDEAGRLRVTLALASFERSVGRLRPARRRLEELTGERPGAAALPGTLRKRALDLAAQIAVDERAQGLDDWPATALAAADRAAVARAETLLGGGEAGRALGLLAPILVRLPAAVEARWAEARALEALGRFDEAARELAVVVQLQPSHAAAWRRLGMVLAVHGGTLDADRADEALRHALVLEPSWDDLRDLRRRVAAKREPVARDRPLGGAPAPPPSDRAQKLFDEAQRWMADGSPEFAEPLAAQALADSPAYVAAAALHYALTGNVPEATLRALWNDAEALTRLASEVWAIGRDGPPSPIPGRCLDRAVALGWAEARFGRAQLRAAGGDRGGALADLTDYVAHEPGPAHLDEARALRATLRTPQEAAAAGADTAASGTRRAAQLALLADRPREAESLLGGPCRAGLAPARLVELGRVHEYAGEVAPALGCYRLAYDGATRQAPGAARATTDPLQARTALERLAAVGARAPAAELERLEEPLRLARRAQIPAAAWALARLALQRQRPDEALADIEAFLTTAQADDPLLAEAQAARASLLDADRAARGARATRELALALLAALAVAALVGTRIFRRHRGATLTRALARRPGLFPELARAVAEVRHDVLKHRASALGFAAHPGPRRQDVARALLEPRPTSAVVAEIYGRVAQAAAGMGLALCPLEREPTFGPLARDLRRAEAVLGAQQDDDPALASLPEIDRALREEHAARLAHLLTLGPRTTLDASRLTGWIRAVEAERGASLPVGLVLRDIDLSVGVEEDALFTIVSNLLRNAGEAAAHSTVPRVLVRVEREADVTGRQLVTVLVADSAPQTPSLAEIEARDGQRGLGLARDLTRRWGGHLVVRAEPAPLHKAIGAVFPALPALPSAGALPGAAGV